jgi:hypothetical protein
VRRLLHRLPILALNAPTAGQPVDAVGLKIDAGKYGKHTGHGARGARVDGLDFRMRVRRAHENASDHLGPLDIGDVIAAPGQEAEILLAAWGSANPDYFGHGSPPVCAACVAAASTSKEANDGLASRASWQVLPSSQWYAEP